MNRLIIIGASGHGKVVADIAQKNGYKEIFFLDDNNLVKECLGYPVIGKSSDLDKYSGYDCFIAIGNAIAREKLYIDIKGSVNNLVTLIHPNATIANAVKVGNGTVVMAGAVVNSGTTIGNCCIINTGATVDHDNFIDDFTHISVGVHIAGTVKIGKCTWIGIGSTVINNINICANCFIGAGAVVVKDIKEAGIYVGVPAKLMRK